MAQPRYLYDPITQSYKLVDPTAPAQPIQQGIGSLYDSGGGGNGTTVGGPGPSMTDPGMAEIGVGLQNFGQFANTASPIAMMTSPVTTAASAIAGNIGNAMMGTTVSPVANPTAPEETAIAPATMGLAAMNAAQAQENNTPNVSVATPADVAEAVAGFADATDAEAGAANAAAAAQAAATAASDSGGATATGAGEASDAGVSGANSEASHSADGNNSGDSGDSGGGCFLTTAAVKHMGQKDDGEVLNTLRNFRDTYMKTDKNKSKDVEWYYKNAPKIMRELDKREDADVVYKRMYRNYIEPAYKAIKNGNKREAYDIYRQLVNYAKDKSGIESKKLSPKPKHYAAGGGIGGALVELIKNKGLYGGEHGMYNYDPETQTFNLNNQSFGDMPIPLAGQSVAYPQGGRGDRMYTYKPESQSFEKNFAGGGMADAAKTQAQGRGNDTMLVHMTPREVQGLQALAMANGGSLTINPKTGLPEAGFLDAVLPMVAGAALVGLSGGALTPLMAAGIVGGGTAMMTGDLSKGFMAGLGAFGGAGIGAGLAGAGAATAPAVTGTQAGLTAAGQAAAAAPTATMVPNAVSGGSSLLQAAGTTMPASGAATFIPTAAQTSSTAALQAAAGTPSLATAAAPVATGPSLAQMGQGISALGTEAGRAGFMQGVGGGTGLLTYGGAAGSALMSGMEEEPEGPGKRQTYIRPYKYDAQKQDTQQDFKYRTGAPGESTSELTYFKPSLNPQGVYRYEDYMSQNMAGGGIASMAKGRYLKGAGDGMSDDIPATIEGGQPARLADGEFVVPADVVSHLGNGSSNAGAKKLYKMMDRIRTARTGKKGQAPEVKTDKYMPA